MDQSQNPEKTAGLFGVSVHGLEGISDDDAKQLVGGVFKHVADAADRGGEASKAFLKELQKANNIEIFVTKDTCVAYSEGITDSVKINPSVYAIYRRYPSEKFEGKVEDFEAILVHELTHRLPKLDFPATTPTQGDGAQTGTASWNAPQWKENAAPIESDRFAKALAADRGITGVGQYLLPGGAQHLRGHAEEELRAMRVTNAVMHEAREDYMPRRYYEDLGMSKPGCTLEDGENVRMRDGGIAIDLKIRLEHWSQRLMEKLGEYKDDLLSHEPGKSGMHPAKENSGSHSKVGVDLHEAPGKIAADRLLAVVAEDSARPQAAIETIHARIAENKALVMAQGETYSVQRIEQAATKTAENFSIEGGGRGLT